jgi:hypothetical protein
MPSRRSCKGSKGPPLARRPLLLSWRRDSYAAADLALVGFLFTSQRASWLSCGRKTGGPY